MANIQNDPVIGKQFGFLTILEVTQLGNNTHKRQKKVKARCKCGSVKEYFLGNLRKKDHSTSCGCHRLKATADANRTHGLSRRNALYIVWAGIKRRCYNKNAEDYGKYGAKGVRMSDEWKGDYKAFYDWCMANGYKPGLQIDKDIKAKSLGMPPLLYSPETCTIVTCKRNQNSRKNNILVQYKGGEKTLKQIAELTGVKYHLLWKRFIELKWDIERAISTPPRKVRSGK